MPLFISRGNYSRDAIGGMLAKPEDRTEAVSKVFASLGAKLHALYYTLGEHDFLIIVEAPSEKELVAGLIVAAGTGTVTNLNTTLAWTADDMKDAFVKAGSVASQFRPAGRS
jgi:uncharacterized protein with GYD domain